MPIKITEIRNLTNSKFISLTSTPPVVQTELDKFVWTESDAKVVGTALLATTLDGNFAAANDNIQVTGIDGTTTHRAVGGKFSLAGTTATISNLVDVSKYSIGLTGALEIGPPGGAAALISVSIGNLNPAHDWIIDFADKQDGAKGSEIRLQALLDWIKDKNKENAEIALPEIKKPGDVTSKKLDASEYTIVFNSFYFNITQKTFDFWVSSKAGESITFGDFTIKSVGFRVTNVPVSAPVTAQKPKEITAPSKDDKVPV